MCSIGNQSELGNVCCHHRNMRNVRETHLTVALLMMVLAIVSFGKIEMPREK